MNRGFVVALCGLALGACGRRSPTDRVTAAPDPVQPDPVKQAREDFELVAAASAGGTSRLYSRGDFLPTGDARAFDEGDFIGRLRTLFGPAPGDLYVLRDRKTALVVTAYSAKGGPVYGGNRPARTSRLSLLPIRSWRTANHEIASPAMPTH